MKTKEQKKEIKLRIEAKTKAEKFVADKAKRLSKEMPKVTEMTDSEYHAMVFGMHLCGYNPMWAIDLVIAQVKTELLLKKEA